MINENIKRARKKRGVSQEEMAAELNVVRQTVSKWETGRSVPNAEMLVQIAGRCHPSVLCCCNSRVDSKKRTVCHSYDVCLHDSIAGDSVQKSFAADRCFNEQSEAARLAPYDTV